MKTLARLGLALGVLSALTFPALAQSQNPEWVEVAPFGDTFRVSLPSQPRIERESLGAVSGNRYVTPSVGAVYTLWSVKNANYRSGEDIDQYLDATAELVWEGLLRPAREKLDEEERSRPNPNSHRSASIAFVKELPTNGENSLPGREYTLTIGDFTGTAQFFVAHERIYVLLAMGQPGRDWPREKFFASFRPASPMDPDIVAPSKSLQGSVTLGPVTPNGADDYNRVFSGKEVTQKAHILEKAEPTYTESARKFGVQGTVVIRGVFSSNGEVTDLKAIRKLPHGLTQRSLAAARAIRFTPAMKDGHAVSMWMQFEYNFVLY